MVNIPMPLILLLIVVLILILIEINSHKNKGKKKIADKISEIERHFEFTIFDIRERPEKIIIHYIFVASSPEEARKVARDILKESDSYRQNEDVRELVRFEELGGETAGHEFDVLPEALRRVRLEIRPFEWDSTQLWPPTEN